MVTLPGWVGVGGSRGRLARGAIREKRYNLPDPGVHHTEEDVEAGHIIGSASSRHAPHLPTSPPHTQIHSLGTEGTTECLARTGRPAPGAEPGRPWHDWG